MESLNQVFAYTMIIVKMILVGAVPYLVIRIPDGLEWAGKFIGTAFDYLESLTTNKYLIEIEHEAEKCVVATYQGLLKDAKKKCADGEISGQELLEFKGEAKKLATENLKKFLKALPARMTNAFEHNASSWIEAAIPKVKAKAEGLSINPSTTTTD